MIEAIALHLKEAGVIRGTRGANEMVIWYHGDDRRITLCAEFPATESRPLFNSQFMVVMIANGNVITYTDGVKSTYDLADNRSLDMVARDALAAYQRILKKHEE